VRRIRFPQRKKKEAKKKETFGTGEGLLKLPQLRKSESDAFGNFFLMISTSCLDKPSEKHARLIHSSNRPDDDQHRQIIFANYLVSLMGCTPGDC
jgi:hypothetical protein